MNDKNKVMQDGTTINTSQAEEKENKAKTVEPNKETQKAEKDNLHVWLGPTLSAVVRKGAAIKGQMPAELKKLMEQMPQAAVLYVPMDKVLETNHRLENPYTAEGQLFEKIRKEWNYV